MHSAKKDGAAKKRARKQTRDKLLGSPVVPFSQFFGQGSPIKCPAYPSCNMVVSEIRGTLLGSLFKP